MMMIRGRVSLTCYVVGLAVLALPRTATMASNIRMLTVSELTKRSELVVTGKVLSLSSKWNDAHNNIFTYVEVQIDKVLKGDHQGRTVTIKLHGGIVGTTTIAVSNSPRFAVEERVLLFLAVFDRDETTNAPLNYIPYNLVQGKLSILVNKAGEDVLFWPSARMQSRKPAPDIAQVFSGEPQLLTDMVKEVETCMKKEAGNANGGNNNEG